MLMTDWVNSTTHAHFSTAATKGGWNLWAPYDINEHIGMTVTKNNVGSYQLITFPINNRLYTIFWIKGKGCLTCRLHEYVISTIQTRWYIEMVTISMGLNKSTAHLDEWDF